jgi:uncharacterized membrane protein
MSQAPDPVATRIRGSAPSDDGPLRAPETVHQRPRTGLLMVLLSLLALVAAGYLTWVKLSGTVPACAIVSGCETVEQSSYSEFLGIPVAAFGMLGAAALLVGSLLWWLRGDRRGLLLAYGVGLASLPIIAWLTYLELAVIHAVCIWCVAYAALMIGAWLVAMVSLRTPAAGAAQ